MHEEVYDVWQKRKMRQKQIEVFFVFSLAEEIDLLVDGREMCVE